MSKTIQAIRGMNDILPESVQPWQLIESSFRRIANSYGYSEIRFPIVEQASLFARSIGNVTDIVEKEMYVFEDRNGDHLALRPEGTAGCVRAVLEHSLAYGNPLRLWYMGPMFRHERPQKGRYRQFFQFGVECFGYQGPDIDVEIIALTHRLWKELGIDQYVTLEVNSLGSRETRAEYKEKLVEYFQDHVNALDEDSQRRLTTNPLRILDSKVESIQPIIAGAPKLLDHLDEVAQVHFDGFLKRLQQLDIPYRINPCLVRGLDYYGKTVFEWTTDQLGSQGTLCAGGRYDSLAEMLGGRATPAVGFAAGLERIVALMQQVAEDKCQKQVADIYIATIGEAAEMEGMLLAERLRNRFPKMAVICHAGGGGFKSQFKRADKSGARLALIMGDEEIENQVISVKPLREEQSQLQLSEADLMTYLTEQNVELTTVNQT